MVVLPYMAWLRNLRNRRHAKFVVIEWRHLLRCHFKITTWPHVGGSSCSICCLWLFWSLSTSTRTLGHEGKKGTSSFCGSCWGISYHSFCCWENGMFWSVLFCTGLYLLLQSNFLSDKHCYDFTHIHDQSLADNIPSLTLLLHNMSCSCQLWFVNSAYSHVNNQMFFFCKFPLNVSVLCSSFIVLSSVSDYWIWCQCMFFCKFPLNVSVLCSSLFVLSSAWLPSHICGVGVVATCRTQTTGSQGQSGQRTARSPSFCQSDPDLARLLHVCGGQWGSVRWPGDTWTPDCEVCWPSPSGRVGMWSVFSSTCHSGFCTARCHHSQWRRKSRIA